MLPHAAPEMLFFQTLARLCFPFISHCIYENSVFTTGKNSKQLRAADWHAVSLGINFVWTVFVIIFLIESDVKVSSLSKWKSGIFDQFLDVHRSTSLTRHKNFMFGAQFTIYNYEVLIKFSFHFRFPLAQYVPCASTTPSPVRWLCTLKNCFMEEKLIYDNCFHMCSGVVFFPFMLAGPLSLRVIFNFQLKTVFIPLVFVRPQNKLVLW